MSFLTDRLAGQHRSVLLVLLLSFSGQPATAHGQSNTNATDSSTASSALDDQLFRDLGGIRDGLPHEKSSATGTADRLPRNLNREDSTGQGNTDAWSTIVRRMREVERRLQQEDAGQATQEIQQEIVTELERLLQQTATRAQAKTTRRQQRAGPSPSAAGQVPAGVSTSPDPTAKQEGRPAITTVPGNRPEFRLDATWSHLPSRIREQLQAVGQEQFLPDYARQIEAYYRSLSESESSNR